MAKKKKKKWYVVWQGRNPGIYETWDECNDQAYKVRGAQYKSYTSRLQAINAFKHANYVVWRGKEPGVYQGWKECRKQVEGFGGAKYQSFSSRERAEKAFESWDDETEEFEELDPSAERHIHSILSETPVEHNQKPLIITNPILDSITVDAACRGNPGLVEYRGVRTETGEQIFKQGPFPDGTNNIGEFLALVHGLAFLKREGVTIPVYSDSKIAINWVKAKKCKTNIEQADGNNELFGLIKRAEKWLSENEFENKVCKWDTDIWGEIPADFGRK